MEAIRPDVADGFIACSIRSGATADRADGFRITNEIRFDAWKSGSHVVETADVHHRLRLRRMASSPTGKSSGRRITAAYRRHRF
jgi:hypothetical protein